MALDDILLKCFQGIRSKVWIYFFWAVQSDFLFRTCPLTWITWMQIDVHVQTLQSLLIYGKYFRILLVDLQRPLRLDARMRTGDIILSGLKKLKNKSIFLVIVVVFWFIVSLFTPFLIGHAGLFSDLTCFCFSCHYSVFHNFCFMNGSSLTTMNESKTVFPIISIV